MIFTKHLKRVFSFLFFSFSAGLLLLSLLITGCANSLDEADFSDTVYTNQHGVTLVVKSQDNIIDFSNTSARTILPGSDSYKDMYFYLWGKNKITGQEIAVSKAEFNPTTDSTTGTININQLASTSYELYLGATKTEITNNDINLIKQNLYYVGFATADLRYSTQVVFYLTPYAVSGYGSVSLKLYFPWSFPGYYNVLTGLYDLTTDAEIRQNYTTDSGVINPGTIRQLASLPSDAEHAESFEVIKIKPGTYNFKVSFEGLGKRYLWADTITILANRQTSATIAVPNIVENPEITAPSGFIAGYCLPSGSDAENAEYYPVEFSWTDNSNNETHFELEMLDVTRLDYSIDVNNAKYNQNIARVLDASESLSNKNAGWQTLLGTNGVSRCTYSPDFYGDSNNPDFSSFCTAGSLLVNNQFVVLSMNLGHRYLARLRAVNNVGQSDYVYLDLTNAGSYSLKDTGSGQSFATWPAGSTSINLYRIKYFTNNGNFYDSANSRNVSTIQLYEFANQVSNSSHQVMNPVNYRYDSSTGDSATLQNISGSLWTKWQLSYPGGQDFDAGLLYSGYDNINLFAYYDGTAASDITFEANSDLKIYGGTTEDAGVIIVGVPPTLPYDADTYIITGGVSRTTYQSMWFYISNPLLNQTQRKYSAFKLTVSENYGLFSERKEHKATYDVNTPHFFVDISDTAKYPAGNWYWAEVTLTPTTSPTNKKTITIRFYITD